MTAMADTQRREFQPGDCYRCGAMVTTMVHPPSMYCSDNCRTADEEITRLQARIRQLEMQLSGGY